MRKATYPSRVDVWQAMADHFLDTEVRHQVPKTALCCISHGLTVSEAFDVWRFEVTPAVWFNCWDIAGEWASFDRRWLVRTIHEQREAWPTWARWWGHVRYRRRVYHLHREWSAIAKCMKLLLDRPVAEHAGLTAQMDWLARHYFDMPPSVARPGSRATLRTLFEDQLKPILVRQVAGLINRKACRERVERALRHDNANATASSSRASRSGRTNSLISLNPRLR